MLGTSSSKLKGYCGQNSNKQLSRSFLNEEINHLLRYFKMLTGSFGLNNLFYPFWNNISQSCQCHNGAKGAIHVQCPSRGLELRYLKCAGETWEIIYTWSPHNAVSTRASLLLETTKNSSWPVTGLWSRGPLKDLKDSKLILNDHLV